MEFGGSSPFDLEKQATLCGIADLLAGSPLPSHADIRQLLRATVQRVDSLSQALASWPPVFEEQTLGARRRGLGTLVDLLAGATDANLDLFLPTRALVGRTLLMAELNAWRLASHVLEQVLPAGAAAHPLREQVDRWLHECIHTKIAEEVLDAICSDGVMERRVRERGVEALAQIWENRPAYRVRNFFPLLEATWNARRRIRVSIGTLLGVSEILRLIQAGCDPRFVDYFSRPRLTQDEREAFQEFLIGVPTEEIHSLEQYMAQSGRTALSPEETAHVLTPVSPQRDEARHPGVRAYEFFRERYLQAAARRLKKLPGPKKTAEEYVMIYYLDRESPGKEPGGGT